MLAPGDPQTGQPRAEARRGLPGEPGADAAGDAFAAAMLDRLVEEMPAGAAPGQGLGPGVGPDPGPAEALREIGVGAIRGLLERASVSAALTCERAGAQSPDARTLDAATADVLRSPLPAEQRGSPLSAG